MTYRNENTVLSTGSNNNESVFSHILIRDYVSEEAGSPELPHIDLSSTVNSPETTEDSEVYWWNSKLNKKSCLGWAFHF